MVVFEATPEQIIEGEPLSYETCVLTCAETGVQLREGDEILLHVDHHPESEAWSHVGVYDASITSRAGLFHDHEELTQVLARGRIAIASDCADQSAWPIIHNVDIFDVKAARQ